MTDAYTPQVSDEAPEPVSDSSSMWTPTADRARIDREAAFYPATSGLGLREAFRDALIGPRLFGWLDAESGERFERHRNRMFGVDAPLSPDEANERYGVPGRLTFDSPVSESVAGWRQGLAQREAFREAVYANTDAGPLSLLGASLAGSVLDPVGLPLWLVPELATGRALRSGVAASRLGGLGAVQRGVLTGSAEGTAGGLLYEGVNLWLHHEGAEDYDLADASANVLFGGVLGGGVGGIGGWWTSRGAAPRAPAAVAELPEPARAGAFAEALDAVMEDRPVDLGPMLAREAEVRTRGGTPDAAVAGLDEIEGAEPTLTLRGAAGAPEGVVAVTPRGVEVPVRYALVEAEDLVTSHDDDLFANPEYPADLQPRRRDRAGAQARNRTLEAELNPKRLMFDVGAETGAPIIARDGTVESGNGRTIAVRRAYRNGGAAAARYRAELEARGLDVSGMERPVLVRVRENTLTGAERVRLTRDMNAETTEAYSPSERAVADAGSMDDGLLDMIEGGDLNGAGNRRFVRAFLDRVAGDDLNRMTTGDGRLSEAGLDRINAALVARAYGDRQLVEALFEATDSNIKAIGRALADAAPQWAAMRAAIARGEVPAELDVTDALRAAVAFVRHVRERRGNLSEAMDLIVGQQDAFSGDAMTLETEAFVRSFFRTSKEGATLWKSPRGAASLADGLRWLAGEIRKAQPGPDLFGGVADEATGRQLLDGLGRWFARQSEDAEGPVLFPEEPRPGSQPAPGPDGGNVRPDGDDGGRVVGRQDDGGPAAREGVAAEKPRVPKGETPQPPRGDPYADDDVRALAADTDAALARAGIERADIETATPEGQDPQTVADAVAAAAFCLKGGGA